jgi:hypothetical protein
MSSHIILNNFIKNLLGNKTYKRLGLINIISALIMRYEDVGETQ